MKENLKISIPNFEVPENLTKDSMKDFEKSDAYKKYVLPYIKEKAERKRNKRITWLKNNAFNIINLFFTIITLLSTIILGILQLQN